MLDKALLSRFDSIETPFYYYDSKLLRETLAVCKSESEKYNFHVHYAMKANFNSQILDIVREVGFGVDCVSGNEVQKAADLGFEGSQIVFAGVGKSDKEIETALRLNIFCFNVESLQELEVINQIAQKRGVKARVAIRINPNVDAKTHKYITTGLEENKFGINAWELPLLHQILKDSSSLEFMGVHFHVGSQILDFDVFVNLCNKINEMQQWLREQGMVPQMVNVGGGVGIDYYHPDKNPIVDFASYFSLFHQYLELEPHQTVHFELGRSLVAQCGSLISRVLYVKNGISKDFIILDAGMTELMRPALYSAHHEIENISSLSNETKEYDVVGPICESSDTFAKNRPLPITQRGDLIALRSAGAYGEVMASRYNLRDEIRSLVL